MLATGVFGGLNGAVRADPDGATTRHTFPSAAEQKAASRRIDQIYHEEIVSAKAAKDKVALAERFLATAEASSTDAERFVLLSMARDLAARSGSASIATSAIDKLADSFDIDAVKMRVDALVVASKVQGGASSEDFETVINSAIAAERYDIAKQAAQSASVFAARSGKQQMTHWSAALTRDLDERMAAYHSAVSAEATLRKTPDDSTAALSLGRFRCFFKDDWERGLPLLASGNDPALKPLAREDLAGGSTSSVEISLGDQWLAAARTQTGIVRRSEEDRAAKWYRAALPDLRGLDKAAVEKKLDILSDRGWFVLFRSADPSIWNTNTSGGPQRYAVPLSRCPDDIRYLKLSAGDAGYVILAVTKDQLPKLNSGAKFNWNGSGHKEWGAIHLGITNDISMANKGIGFIVVTEGYKGWGFGHKIGYDGKQCWSWAGEEIPSTVFEISVTASPLQPEELKFLLHQ